MSELVSVVIPTKNRSKLVCRAVRSVIEQRDVDVQLIVVDDGSTDDTRDALLALRSGVVDVVSLPASAGVSAARNTGLARADGRWLAFLDDDDLWAPDKLASQLQALGAADAAWCYAGAVMVDSDLQLLHAPIPDPADEVMAGLPVRNRMPAGSSNVIVDRAVVTHLGGFDTTLRYHEDWDLWIRIGQEAGTPICIAEPLAAFTLHAHNVTLAASDRSRVSRLFADLAIVEKRYAHLRDGEPADRAMVWRYLASQYVRSGRRVEGLRAAARASMLDLRKTARWGRTHLSRTTDEVTAYQRRAEAWLDVERQRDGVGAR